MKNILIAFILLFCLGILNSCYYDEPPKPLPFVCAEVSYSTHIMPIFENLCSTSGCHDGTREPNLEAEVSWNALRSGGYINTTNPEVSSLYRAVDFLENPMPPGGPKLTDLNIELILCWMSEGALNN